MNETKTKRMAAMKLRNNLRRVWKRTGALIDGDKNSLLIVLEASMMYLTWFNVLFFASARLKIIFSMESFFHSVFFGRGIDL